MEARLLAALSSGLRSAVTQVCAELGIIRQTFYRVPAPVAGGGAGGVGGAVSAAAEFAGEVTAELEDEIVRFRRSCRWTTAPRPSRIT